MTAHQVWLGKQEMDLVRALSKRTGRSIADIVESAMQAYVGEQMRKIAWHEESQR